MRSCATMKRQASGVVGACREAVQCRGRHWQWTIRDACFTIKQSGTHAALTTRHNVTGSPAMSAASFVGASSAPMPGTSLTQERHVPVCPALQSTATRSEPAFRSTRGAAHLSECCRFGCLRLC